jgi:hypothetical protein
MYRAGIFRRVGLISSEKPPFASAHHSTSLLALSLSNGRPQERRSALPAGGGFIWNRIPFEMPVISAKAGVQSFGGALPLACAVDSRFRGNDCAEEPPSLSRE